LYRLSSQLLKRNRHLHNENSSIVSIQRGTPSMTFGGTGSGKPPGRPRGSRNALSEAVVCAFLRDFREHGQRAIAKVRRTQPAVYCKLAVLLVPKEHKVEHSNNAISSLSDEELDAAIEHIKAKLAARAGETPKIIEGTVEPTAVDTTRPLALEPSKRRSNRLMMEADTAIGSRERKPRKRKVPSSTDADGVP
jgi:hypothetical protein